MRAHNLSQSVWKLKILKILLIDIINFKLRMINLSTFLRQPLFLPDSLDFPCILLQSQGTSSFSSRPRSICCTRARAHRPTGSLESNETTNMSNDDKNAEELCLQEDPKALKERVVENFNFYYFSPC